MCLEFYLLMQSKGTAAKYSVIFLQHQGINSKPKKQLIYKCYERFLTHRELFMGNPWIIHLKCDNAYLKAYNPNCVKFSLVHRTFLELHSRMELIVLLNSWSRWGKWWNLSFEAALASFTRRNSQPWWTVELPHSLPMLHDKAYSLATKEKILAKIRV